MQVDNECHGRVGQHSTWEDVMMKLDGEEWLLGDAGDGQVEGLASGKNLCTVQVSEK